MSIHLSHRSAHAALMAASLLLPAAAFAADTDTPFYAGLSAGVKSSFHFNAAANLSRNDDARTTGKLYGGYVFGTDTTSRQPITHALEVAVYTGKSEDTSFKRGTTYAPGSGEMLGLGLAYAASYDLAPGLSLTGRAGIGYSRSEVTFVTGPRQTTSDTSLMFGLGAAYKLTEQWSLHADWDRMPVKFDSGKDKLNMLSVGVRYRF